LPDGSSDSGASAEDQSKSKYNMWEDIENSFKDTMHDAQVAYRTNYFLNLIIVAIGIVLLGSSLLFAWTRGLNPDTLTFAGLGIADFTAIFLVNPQFRIQQLLGDLNQIQVIYRTWRDQLGMIDNYTASPVDSTKYKDMTFAEIQAVDDELNKIGQEALSAIETYIGAKGDSTQPPSGSTGAAQTAGKTGDKPPAPQKATG
jgi:hypothetical protein